MADIQGRRVVLIDDVLTSGATSIPAPGLAARQSGAGSTCWCLPGLWTATKRPYNRAYSHETEREMTAAIEIYTRPGCGYCNCGQIAADAQECAVQGAQRFCDPGYREQMYQRCWRRRNLPANLHRQDHVGGCDELYALDREGKLDGLLSAEGIM
jgi:glutaredoxin 3